MGYAPGYISYPYRVREGKKWSKKYKKSINEAISSIKLKDNDIIIITGSLYLAGEVLNLN